MVAKNELQIAEICGQQPLTKKVHFGAQRIRSTRVSSTFDNTADAPTLPPEAHKYAALASHFAFDPLYCMPRSGNEKPIVAIRVKTLGRNWSTPVPQVNDMDELNAYLRQRCVAELERVSSRQTDTIGVRFEEEKAVAAALPNHSFDACIRWNAKVDKYQFARFDNVNDEVIQQRLEKTSINPRRELPATLRRGIPPTRALHFPPAKRYTFSPPSTLV